MKLSVIVATHNPAPGRLARTFAALYGQAFPANEWEIVLVDNASTSPVNVPTAPPHSVTTRRIHEPSLGLTAARKAGITASRGDLIVLVDDDNVLAPDYLARVVEIFARHPRLGAAGGKSVPEFEIQPDAWMREFDSLLACRDLGSVELIATALWNSQRGRNEYPPFAPIGAGMALRRAGAKTWLDQLRSTITDRRGSELSSGGDNDIILTLLAHDWHVGYFPELTLTHLIAATRLDRDYLARLNRGIAKSWIQVLAKHQACPWSSIRPWTAPLRKLKGWFVYRAWSSPAAFVRWQGACGHFEGRALPLRP